MYYRTKVKRGIAMFQKQNVPLEQSAWIPLRDVAGKDVRDHIFSPCEQYYLVTCVTALFYTTFSDTERETSRWKSGL